MQHINYTLKQPKNKSIPVVDIKFDGNNIKDLEQLENNNNNKFDNLTIKINKTNINIQKIAWIVDNNMYTLCIPRLFVDVWFELFENFPDPNNAELLNKLKHNFDKIVDSINLVYSCQQSYKTINSDDFEFKFNINLEIYYYFETNKHKLKNITFYNGNVYLTGNKNSTLIFINFHDLECDYLRLYYKLFGRDIDLVKLYKQGEVNCRDAHNNYRKLTYEDCQEILKVFMKMIDIYKKYKLENKDDENDEDDKEYEEIY